MSAYLDSCWVFGEVEEPLRWTVKDPPVVVPARHAVRTPRDNTLHHVNSLTPPAPKPNQTGLTAHPRTACNDEDSQTTASTQRSGLFMSRFHTSFSDRKGCVFDPEIQQWRERLAPILCPLPSISSFLDVLFGFQR